MVKIGEMFVLKEDFHPRYDREFIVVEKLTNTVALQETVENKVIWETLHILKREYKSKEQGKKNG